MTNKPEEITIIPDDNSLTDNLDIIAPSDIDGQSFPSVTDIFAPQELRAESLSVGDYCDVDIIVHDAVIVPIEVDKNGSRQTINMVAMSVTIPDAMEYGIMSTTAWSVVKNFKWMLQSGKFQPMVLQFYAKETRFGQMTYHIKVE